MVNTGPEWDVVSATVLQCSTTCPLQYNLLQIFCATFFTSSILPCPTCIHIYFPHIPCISYIEILPIQPAILTEQRLSIPSSEKHVALIQEHSFLLSVVCELLKGLGKWDREACGRHQFHRGLLMVGLCLSLNLSPFLVCKKGLKCRVELCPC